MTTILVTGPEASGTKMVARMLAEAGGTVLHKPMPMSTRYPDLTDPSKLAHPDGLWHDFTSFEWDQAVVIIRHPAWTVAAQADIGHTRSIDHAIERTRQALVNIFAQLGPSGRPWWCVSYEGLEKREAVAALCDLLGLDGTVVTGYRDANAKWYGGAHWSDRSPLWRARPGVDPPVEE